MFSWLWGRSGRKKAKKRKEPPPEEPLAHPIPVPFPDPPFVIPIVAKRNSGKTTLLTQLLVGPYRGIFDRVYLWSPSLRYDPKYRLMDLHPGKDSWEHFHEADVEALYKEKERPQFINEHWLFVFDDCMNEKDFRQQNSYEHPLERMANVGRNRKISMIVIVQKATGVSGNIKEQADMLITFKPFNLKQKRALYDVMGVGTEREWVQVMDQYLVEKYKTLAISTKPKDSERAVSWYYDFQNIDEELVGMGLLPPIQSSSQSNPEQSPNEPTGRSRDPGGGTSHAEALPEINEKRLKSKNPPEPTPLTRYPDDPIHKPPFKPRKE